MVWASSLRSLRRKQRFGAFVHNVKRLLLSSGHKADSSRTVRVMPNQLEEKHTDLLKTIVTEANFLRLQNFEQKASDAWSRPIAGDARLPLVLSARIALQPKLSEIWLRVGPDRVRSRRAQFESQAVSSRLKPQSISTPKARES